jgi:hypothetical protein
MAAYPIQISFTRGELDPLLHARIDLEYYKTALKRATNWTVLRQGGLRKREGFVFKQRVKNDAKRARLIPFIFSTEQAYVLEVGDGYIRKFTTSGQVTRDGGTPTAITQANPGVATIPGHLFTTGDKVFSTDIGGMIELNNRELTVTVLGPNQVELGVDTTNYTAFTSGGLIKKIVETSTPYTEADVPDLDYAQTADVLTLVHQSRKPRELSRLSALNWSLDNISFKDGPYLDPPLNNSNGLKPSATNAIHPLMTSNAAPSGTVADIDGDANAYLVFDGNPETVNTLTSSAGWMEYDPPGTAVCNSYWIQCDPEQVGRAPSSWTFQGWDGADWVDLDSRSAESSWGGGETRFFEFTNVTAYQKYRLKMNGTNGSGLIAVAEMGWGYNGDFAPTMTLTFDTLAGINKGNGFDANDVGRHIRFKGSDGKWRWFIIEGVSTTKIVTGRMYGYALPSLSKIYSWQLGAWKADQWPGLVQFYESRRAFARTAAEPNGIWLTKTFDFYDMGTSQPLADDDAMRLRILSNEVNAITFLSELERLAIGTTGGVRVLGKANANAGFGASNFDLLPNVFTRSRAVKPVRAGSALLFGNYFGKTLHELVYSLEQDGYIAPNVAILSEHLMRGKIREMAFQETPNSVVWIVTNSGRLVAMTYEREQKVVGFTEIEVGGGDPGTQVDVESVACIPSDSEDQVWIIVERTINGSTVRSIEVKSETWNYARGDTVPEAIYADSALVYSGSATNVVGGLWHLRNQPVAVLADGLVYRNLTVSNTGTLALPNDATASKWTVGLAYQAYGRTLALNEYGQKDGAGLGRRKILNEVKVDAFETLSLYVKGIKATDAYDVFRRRADDPVEAAMIPKTGIFDCRFDNSWREDGEFIFFSSDPLPCTIRAFTTTVTGEP